MKIRDFCLNYGFWKIVLFKLKKRLENYKILEGKAIGVALTPMAAKPY